MRLPSHPPTTLSCLFLLLPSLATAISLDCSDIRVDRTPFNLKPLDGPHNIYKVKEHPNSITNTTFTINICRPLEKNKGVPKDEDCPNGSRVCAIERLQNTVENVTTIIRTIPIAGEYGHSGFGGNLDPKWTRMKSSESSADREREGIRLQIGGGRYDGKDQKAIVEFLCDAKKENNTSTAENEEDHKYGNAVDDEHGGTIEILSWNDEDDAKVLRLEWNTRFACEDAKDGDSSSGGWGFFTWFILIVFMGVAAYLIFGSWLNYNRYSARGWDLVPHSETIRDIPYMFRDWVRSVINTIQGGGSRGGYSAV
ncbi:hypothetical protein OEA41_005153 [Lepraria neglecta]|uniref:Autophagy-related protein 27 n=1 Tax=Lepraria neglecta TaxID=209136 RepID=A0AAD9Z002_9LECA|nr:hypothetical protein OEA41_005153 [Lepraria neglecta]